MKALQTGSQLGACGVSVTAEATAHLGCGASLVGLAVLHIVCLATCALRGGRVLLAYLSGSSLTGGVRYGRCPATGTDVEG